MAVTDETSERGQRGIQSVEVGGQLLIALAHSGRPMALKDLAREAGMAPAKAHPYLVSFGKLGLIAQDEASGRYGLGPLAMQLGLISLQQFDPVRMATPLLRELAQELGHTMAVAVWGNRGATIVRIEEAPSAVHVNMRHGTVMTLRGTASGMLFAAHLPREQVLATLAGVELEDGPAKADAFRVVDSVPGRVLVEVVIHEGRKHIVRRLLAECGYPVNRLVRTAIGPIKLGDLKAGRTRRLNRGEIAALFKAVA